MSDPGTETRETSDTPLLENGNDPYGVLRNRDFLLYLIGRFVASFSQQMLGVTVGWDIYQRTHSTLAIAWVGLVQVVPMFTFTFPAGHVADNYNRKHVLVVMQVVLGVACAGLAVVSYLQADVKWMYVCLFFFGMARTYLWPASASFMPQLVPRRQFARAVTWNAGLFQVSAVLGPAAAGFVMGQSPFWVYVINFVGAWLCALLIGLVRVHHKVIAKEKMSLKSIEVGLKFVYRTKVVLGSITLDLFAVLLGGATALFPVYAKDILHVGPQGLGWLQAALPIGSLLMSVILVHRPPLQKAGRTLLWAVAGFGLATIGFGFAKTFWFAFFMMFLCGVTDYISVVVRHTLVQLRTPDEMRGRVSAINSLFIGTSNQMGDFESGTVAHFTSPVFAVVSGGVGTIFVVIMAAILWPELRNYGRLDA